MANHVKRQARDLVAASLKANTTLEHVDTNRGADLIDADLPAGVVGTAVETVERFTKGTSSTGATQLRTVELTVVVVLNGASDTVDDDADALQAQIEPLIGPALASIARVARFTGSNLDMGADEDGEEWYAFLAMSWEVEIVTAVGDPDTPII